MHENNQFLTLFSENDVMLTTLATWQLKVFPK